MFPTNIKYVLLTEQIKKLFLEGLCLNDDAHNYIDSTFLNPSIAEIEHILQDESNCEKDSFIDLIFFPDESMQVQLEYFLENENFCKEDEKKIADYIFLQNIKAAIFFPDKKDFFKLAMTQASAVQFISRLNISKKLDEKLISAINKHVSKKLRNLVKVKLRNSRIKYDNSKIVFMCSFFKKIKDSDDDFLRCLDFILGFFDEIGIDSDIAHELMRKKDFYFKNLQKAETFESHFKKSNMEILMLQGVKIPYISKQKAQNKMHMIDKIVSAVFGKTNDLTSAHSTNLGSYCQEQDITNLIRILS